MHISSKYLCLYCSMRYTHITSRSYQGKTSDAYPTQSRTLAPRHASKDTSRCHDTFLSMPCWNDTFSFLNSRHDLNLHRRIHDHWKLLSVVFNFIGRSSIKELVPSWKLTMECTLHPESYVYSNQTHQFGSHLEVKCILICIYIYIYLDSIFES